MTDVEETVKGVDPKTEDADVRRRRLAASAAFYSLASALSRIAGIGREIVVASYYGVSGSMSAFAIAAQIPMLVRGLFAEGALQAGFIPVFTELLERGEKKEAFKVASSMISLICVFLGAFSALFILVAPVVVPLFAPGFDNQQQLQDLTTGLAMVMFPSVILVALTGVVAGMLNAFEHFAAPAIAPLAWNLAILGCIIGLTPVFPPEDQVYAYAIGVLAGCVVQFLLPLPWLRGRGGRITPAFAWRSPYVKRILKLMGPVTLTFGLVNVNLLINLQIGTLVSDDVPAAIDKAFRLFQLPSGVFAVPIVMVLFPTFSRLAVRGDLDGIRRTNAGGMRQVLLLLIPSAVFMAVLAVPLTRVVYQRGEFSAADTTLVAKALVWWAIALPFEGAILMLSRTFFGLQRPWVTTGVAVLNLAINAGVALALYDPLGIEGIVIGTLAGAVVMTVVQAIVLRRILGGLEEWATTLAALKMLAAAAVLGGVAYGVWYGLDQALGRSLAAQICSLGVAGALGVAAYGAIVWRIGIPETRLVAEVLRGRFRRGKST